MFFRVFANRNLTGRRRVRFFLVEIKIENDIDKTDEIRVRKPILFRLPKYRFRYGFNRLTWCRTEIIRLTFLSTSFLSFSRAENGITADFLFY